MKYTDKEIDAGIAECEKRGMDRPALLIRDLASSLYLAETLLEMERKTVADLRAAQHQVAAE